MGVDVERDGSRPPRPRFGAAGLQEAITLLVVLQLAEDEVGVVTAKITVDAALRGCCSG